MKTKLKFLKNKFLGDPAQLDIINLLSDDDIGLISSADSDLVFFENCRNIDQIVRLYTLGFIKIGKEVPVVGSDEKLIVESGIKLKTFDLSPDELRIILQKIKLDAESRGDGSMYDYILISAHRPWHIFSQNIDYPKVTFDSNCDYGEIDKLMDGYSLLRYFINRFDDVSSAIESFRSSNFKLGLIRYLPITSLDQMATRSKEKVCDDIEFSDEIFISIYNFLRSEESMFEKNRFVFINSKYEWPRFGFPSHYRIVYKDKVIEGNIN